MQKVLLTIGIQGSGKTTFAKQFAEDNGYFYISSDEVRFDQYPEHGPVDEQDVWHEIRLQLRQAIKEGQNVILDSTMVTKTGRRGMVRFVRSIDPGVQIVGVYVKTELETALERNAEREIPVPEEVVKSFHSRIETLPPDNARDGFNAVLELNENLEPITQWDREMLESLKIKSEASVEFTPKIS